MLTLIIGFGDFSWSAIARLTKAFRTGIISVDTKRKTPTSAWRFGRKYCVRERDRQSWRSCYLNDTDKLN
jgi:Zn-dependent alcohol dehydrogenase